MTQQTYAVGTQVLDPAELTALRASLQEHRLFRLNQTVSLERLRVYPQTRYCTHCHHVRETTQ